MYFKIFTVASNETMRSVQPFADVKHPTDALSGGSSELKLFKLWRWHTAIAFCVHVGAGVTERECEKLGKFSMLI